MDRLKGIMVVLGIMFTIAGAVVSCGGGGGGDGDGAATATVSGTVHDSDSDPVAGALVTITSDPVSDYTDTDGEFSVEVETGEHTITVTVGNTTLYAGSLSVPGESPMDLGNLNPNQGTFYPMTDTDLVGAYFIGVVDVDPDDMDPDGNTAAVAATLDGAGGILYTLIANSMGDTGSGTGSYSVAADGTLTVDGAPGESPYRGQVSPDGVLFSYVDTDTTGDEIAIAFGIIESSGMSTDDFAGTYIMAQLGVGDGTEVWSVGVLLEVDGGGNFYYEELSAEASSGHGTYSVADNGRVTIDGEPDAYAQLSPDGEVLLFVDTSSEDAHLALGLRQPTGMSESDLAGIYDFVAFSFDDGGISSSATARGNVVSDGAGGVVISLQETSYGDTGTFSDTVSVGTDGTIITDAGMIGQLSQDGGFFGFPDVDEGEEDSLFFIGIRKP